MLKLLLKVGLSHPSDLELVLLTAAILKDFFKKLSPVLSLVAFQKWDLTASFEKRLVQSFVLYNSEHVANKTIKFWYV